jgi:(1->4)-alpha-D-glucan 1-alpha-D-glucosylmutase
MTPPLRATYRVQVHKNFTLADARDILSYLRRLGISHLYSSPILTAKPDSTHGYDVCDPTRVNPEIGGEEERRRLVEELRANKLGFLLDIVPNHMAATGDNPFWEDVLANGRESPYATWFDIDWDSPDRCLRGRILLPVLGDKLSNVLDRGELSLVRAGDGVRVKYFDNTFPLNHRTVARMLSGVRVGGGEEESAPSDEERDSELTEFTAGTEGRERLRELLDAQPYALASWRRADKEISYRRFFDINELIGVRQEDPRVFEATHARILEWVGAGEVDSLRIDHIDGLRDPLGYLERLRAEVTRRSPQGAPTYPIVVEKILSGDERLREEWPVQGTTGYEFLNELEGIFIDARGAKTIEEVYRVHRRRRSLEPFAEVERAAKALVLHTSLAVDVHRLARLLQPIARRSAVTAKLTPSVLGEGITAYVVALSVYRTYLDRRGIIHEDDRRVIERALASARAQTTSQAESGDGGEGQEGARRSPAQMRSVLDLLEQVLLDPRSAKDAESMAFIERLQQTTGPATAKGVEDTALYRHVPLLSRNEVGGDPDRSLDDAVARLHARNAERARRLPATLLCTNTHDTKRSADIRSRLDVLTELPERWSRYVTRWRRAHRALRSECGGAIAPDANTEYLLYQTLAGFWPLELPQRTQGTHDDKESTTLRERIDEYMRKAMREAKTHTKWAEPNEEFEKAVERFTGALLEGDEGRTFREELRQLVQQITLPGLWNALARTLVHLTSPGTPDIYQGDELWNFALVDPDNRRPVDFARRGELLEEIERRYADDAGRAAFLRELVEQPEDGRIKLLVTTRALHERREHEGLFTSGDYHALEATGPHAKHLFAFARLGGGEAAVMIVPRLTLSLASDGQAPIGPAIWGETSIALPPELAGRRWRSAFGGHEVTVGEGGAIRVSEALAQLPVALLLER